jgi:hypothetical protein
MKNNGKAERHYLRVQGIWTKLGAFALSVTLKSSGTGED